MGEPISERFDPDGDEIVSWWSKLRSDAKDKVGEACEPAENLDFISPVDSPTRPGLALPGV